MAKVAGRWGKGEIGEALSVPSHLPSEAQVCMLKSGRVCLGWVCGLESRKGQVERWKRVGWSSPLFFNPPEIIHSISDLNTALRVLLFQVHSLLVQEQSSGIKFMSSFRPLCMKYGCKYYFTILFR